MKHGYADTLEGQIHYVTEGSGRSILLLHHTPRSWTYYRHLIPLLSRSHHIIAMDTLGFGNSGEWPPTPPRAADYARNVIHFLDALGVQQADVCGCMTGSRIAMELAIQYPSRVGRIVVWGFPMMLTDDEVAARMAAVKRSALLTPRPDGSHVLELRNFVLSRLGQDTSDGVGRANLSELQLEHLNDWMRDALRAGSRWWQTAVTVYSEDARARLPLVKAPTLVIGLDATQPYENAERSKLVAGLIPGAKFLRLDGDITGITYFQTAELARVIQEFLS